jgi:hypothetical protein
VERSSSTALQSRPNSIHGSPDGLPLSSVAFRSFPDSVEWEPMTRYLSLPPVLDATAIPAMDRTLAAPRDGELLVLAGGVGVVTSPGLAGLRVALDDERRADERVTIQLPLDPIVRRRLVASGLLADLGLLIEPNPPALFGRSWSGVPMSRMIGTGDVVAFATRAWERSRPHGRRLARVAVQFAEELASNSLDHAEDPLGALGLVEVRRGQFEMVVADRGIGLRAALEQAGDSFTSDIDALAAALGVGPHDPPGLGLPELVRLATERAGLRFTARSGHGGVRVERQNDPMFEEFGDGIGGFIAVLRRVRE